MTKATEHLSHIDLKGTSERLYLKQSGVHEFRRQVIFFHDIGEYHDRYLSFSKFLIKKKIGCTFIDMRGHGLSSGTRGHIASYDELINDYQQFWEECKTSYADKEVILVGHGIGALLAMVFMLNHHEVHGCVMANPTIRYKNQKYFKIDEFLGRKLLFDKLKVSLSLMGDDLTNEKLLASNYNHDPLVNKKVTLGMFKSLMDLFKQVKHSSYFINKPLLYIIGEEDNVVDLELSELYATSIDPNVVTVRKYKDIGHELFNEIDRDSVFQDIYNWIEDCFYTTKKRNKKN